MIRIFDEREYSKEERRKLVEFDEWPWPFPPQEGMRLSFRVRDPEVSEEGEYTNKGTERTLTANIRRVVLKMDRLVSEVERTEIDVVVNSVKQKGPVDYTLKRGECLKHGMVMKEHMADEFIWWCPECSREQVTSQ